MPRSATDEEVTARLPQCSLAFKEIHRATTIEEAMAQLPRWLSNLLNKAWSSRYYHLKTN